MTAGALPAMLRPTLRAMNWAPFAVASSVGLAILVVPEFITDRLTPATLATLVRITAACGALGVAFLLDDPALRSTATVPTSRLARHAVRAGLALAVAAVGWGVALLVGSLGAKPSVSAALPRGGLSLEAAVLVAVALGLAASGLRVNPDGNAGVLAAPALTVVLAALWFIPRRVALILPPADPHWAAAHLRWAGLLAFAAALFLWASHEAGPGRNRAGRPARRD